MSVSDSDTSPMLDWTMTAALTAEEAAEAPPVAPPLHPATHPQHTLRFSQWMWVTLGGLALTLILGLLIFSWGAQRRAITDVRNTFGAEEEAALIGNTNSLISLTAPGYSDWLKTRLALARQHMAAPAPALLFNPSPEAGDIISLTTFAPDIMQVDLLRDFTGPAGETTRFSTTQFYQYQNGWKRTPTPPYFSGELRQYEGRRLTIVHYERDAQLINELGPSLDDILESACAEWECADNFNIALQFVEDTPPFEPGPATGPEPLTLKLLSYANTTWLDVMPLNLPAPHIVGTPADEASYAAYERVVGQQVLLYAAHRFIGDRDRPQRNALAYALVARLAAQLNLDSPSIPNIASPPMLTELEALWDLRAAGLWEHPPRRQMILRDTLAMLNVLLSTQSAETERELFRGLARHINPHEWLAQGLGMEYADVQALLAEAGRAALAPQLPAKPEPALALQCASGPQLYFESDNAAVPFISGPFLDAQISGWPWLFTGQHVWSPDGNYLVLNVSGQPALLNLSAQSLTWLDVNGNTEAMLPRGWVSDTILVYLEQSKLHFLDVTQPNRPFPVFVAVADYVLAPDGTRAAVVLEQPDGQGNGQIAVMPATGGPLLNVDFGASPVWTADGSALIYIQHEQYQVEEVWQSRSLIKRADIVNGLRYTVQEGDSMWGIVARYNTTFDAIWAANQMQTNVIVPGQVLIIPIEDSPARVVVTRDLLSSDDRLLFSPWASVAYLTGSPDGEKLAAVVAAQAGDPAQLLLIDADISHAAELSTVLLDTAVGNPQRLIRANLSYTFQSIDIDEATQFILPPRFSADGDFLALLTEEHGLPTLKVYAVAGPWLVSSQSNATSFAWSSTGHRLVVTTNDGTFIVEDGFRTTDGSNKVVTREVCEGVWWRPEH